jgi:hypothetical protein
MRLLSAHSLARKAAGATDTPRTTKPTSELAIPKTSLTSSLQVRRHEAGAGYEQLTLSLRNSQGIQKHERRGIHVMIFQFHNDLKRRTCLDPNWRVFILYLVRHSP